MVSNIGWSFPAYWLIYDIFTCASPIQGALEPRERVEQQKALLPNRKDSNLYRKYVISDGTLTFAYCYTHSLGRVLFQQKRICIIKTRIRTKRSVEQFRKSASKLNRVALGTTNMTTPKVLVQDRLKDRGLELAPSPRILGQQGIAIGRLAGSGCCPCSGGRDPSSLGTRQVQMNAEPTLR